MPPINPTQIAINGAVKNYVDKRPSRFLNNLLPLVKGSKTVDDIDPQVEDEFVKRAFLQRDGRPPKLIKNAVEALETYAYAAAFAKLSSSAFGDKALGALLQRSRQPNAAIPPEIEGYLKAKGLLAKNGHVPEALNKALEEAAQSD